MLQSCVDLGKPRPERHGAGQQLPGKLLELQPDVDQPAVFLAVGGDPLFQFVGLPGLLVDDAALLLDQRIARIADALGQRAGREGCDGKENEDQGAPEADEGHDVSTRGATEQLRLRDLDKGPGPDPQAALIRRGRPCERRWRNPGFGVKLGAIVYA